MVCSIPRLENNANGDYTQLLMVACCNIELNTFNTKNAVIPQGGLFCCNQTKLNNACRLRQGTKTNIPTVLNCTNNAGIFTLFDFSTARQCKLHSTRVSSVLYWVLVDRTTIAACNVANTMCIFAVTLRYRQPLNVMYHWRRHSVVTQAPLLWSLRGDTMWMFAQCDNSIRARRVFQQLQAIQCKRKIHEWLFIIHVITQRQTCRGTISG